MLAVKTFLPDQEDLRVQVLLKEEPQPPEHLKPVHWERLSPTPHLHMSCGETWPTCGPNQEWRAGPHVDFAKEAQAWDWQLSNTDI
jgi:hypothetical protein